MPAADRRPPRPLADPDRDRRGGDERADGAEDEDEPEPAEQRRAQPADRRAEEEAAHLRRAIQPERLAAPLGRRRVA